MQWLKSVWGRRRRRIYVQKCFHRWEAGKLANESEILILKLLYPENYLMSSLKLQQGGAEKFINQQRNEVKIKFNSIVVPLEISPRGCNWMEQRNVTPRSKIPVNDHFRRFFHFLPLHRADITLILLTPIKINRIRCYRLSSISMLDVHFFFLHVSN